MTELLKEHKRASLWATLDANQPKYILMIADRTGKKTRKKTRSLKSLNAKEKVSGGCLVLLILTP